MPLPKLRVLDLFSGIGGFALGMERAGMETVAFCEVNEWCRENALKRNWANVPIFPDVKSLCRRTHMNLEELGKDYDPDYVECAIHRGIDFGECDCIGTDQFLDTYGGIDVITAGVPCQPASIIGQRKGAEDSRWLWPDTFRVINELNPTWVVCENPTGILSLDNGDRFAEIIEEFSQAGYDVWWETIPASAVGGGHRRERTWFVAYSVDAGLERHPRLLQYGDQSRREFKNPIGRITPESFFPTRNSQWWWKDQSPIPIVVDGVSDPAFWKEAVIATGNAVVPQIPEVIGRGIIAMEEALDAAYFMKHKQ